MKVLRKAREIEIKRTVDVLVTGGGPAGIGAAVSAARQGKKVLLLEKRGFLGGNITACYVENCNYYLKGTPFEPEGLYAEILEKCLAKYGNDNIRPRNVHSFSSEYLKVFLDEFVQEAGAEILFHSFVNEVVTEDDQIKAVIIQTKEGPYAVQADVYIDTTGDGDVAFSAGIPYEKGREKDGYCQPGTINVRFAGADVEMLMKDQSIDRLIEIGREFKADYRAGKTGLQCKRQDIPFGRLTAAGIVSYANYSCEYMIDPTTVEGLTQGELACRQYIMDIYYYLKKNYEEFRNLEVASMAPEIGFRDSRRIQGQYHLTIEDMESNRHFDDVITVFPRFYDMLAPDGNMGGDGKVEGKGYEGHIFEAVVDGRTFEIPYGSLVPVNINNLLVAGRCISADHVAESGTRAIYACMLTGEAAGVAAAMASDNKQAPKDIDIKQLQSKLRSQNITLPQD